MTLTPPISDRGKPAVSAASNVAERLQKKILSEFRPGDQLPAEAELAEEFDVSRITIRESLKILSGRGLVSGARGRKAMVTQPDGTMFGAFLTSLIKSDPKSLFDLLQVRRLLEIQSVILATRHGSRAGLAAVEAALGTMREVGARLDASPRLASDELAFHLADVRFHEAMALCGGNRVLTYLFEAMETTLLEAFATSHRGLRMSGQTISALVEAHARLFSYVSARDEKAAIDAIAAILDNAETHLRSVIGNP